MIEIERFEADEVTEVFLMNLRELLSQAFGGKFSKDDWEHALGGTHIGVRESGVLVSHAAVVPRQLYVADDVYSCGYVEAVATLPHRQDQGFGKLAMCEANKIIEGNYEIGALSSSSKDFYRKLGWEDWQGPSYVLTNGEWVRSESEDAGIMVLKTGVTSEMDLSSRIACEARLGDSW